MATVTELVVLAKECNLLGSEKLDNYTMAELEDIYNGVGPDEFPSWMTTVLTFISPTMSPCVLIHDVENHESDGTIEGFETSNDNLKYNGYTMAKYTHAWYNWKRYYVMTQAFLYSWICEKKGWEFWVGEDA